MEKQTGDTGIPERDVKCDACGCAFEPKALTERDGDIDYTFFRCDYCGKAYMVAVMDAKLRTNIAEYVRLAEANKKHRLSERKQRRMQKLKEQNVKMARELRSRYLREEGHGGE